MTRNHPRRRLAGLLVLVALTAGRPAEATPKSPSENARDAVGILVDNQDRCLKLSYGRLDILEGDYTQNEQTEEIEHYLENQNQTSVQVARKALGIARRLARNLERGGKDRASRSITSMVGSQEDLYEWATDIHSWNDASTYRRQIREQVEEFANAQASLPMNLQLDSSERREVIQRYRQQLYGIHGDGSDDRISSAVEEDGGLLSDDSISEQEYLRKKKEYAEWLAEQERREAARLRRNAERRNAMQERLKQGPRELPKLKLNYPEQKQVTVDRARMATWHADYSSRIAPFKQSLSGFLKVQAPTRTLIMFNACLDLARAAETVLEDPKALKAPDPLVGSLLREAVSHFKVASDACINNRLKTTRDSMTEGESSLGETAKQLKRYGLGL